ncbi:MAG: type II/IV secretion system ATPase subunit, partial [Candidatus Thermoplasmatota archaeon]|nr:type II/IV secretion system ATPase subunit [Candidatus Thermoplasmatota archaeon]
MGLLEKAQQKKQTLDKTKQLTDSITSEEIVEEHIEPTGLLEKARKNVQQISKDKGYKKDNIIKRVENQKPDVTRPHLKDHANKRKEILEEKKGFGWKGLGSRKIVFYPEITEYVYEVSEPVLNEHEKETKRELAHLFKMLADVNVSSIDENEKEKYLEETLEQIIIDNDIKFHVEEKEETPKKSIKELLHIKSKTNEETLESKVDKNKSLKKTFLSFTKIKGESGRKKTKEELEEEKKEMELAAKKSKDNIFYHLFREFLGYGKIDILMKDEGIEDISCDGPYISIFLYHKKYEEVSTNICFENPEELDSFAVRLSQICGKQISIYSPIVDGKLPDGSRLQTTLAKTVTIGSTFTIRRFRENPLTPIDLIEFKSLSIDMAAYFWMTIEHGASILFCGGTASGKTTALNALSLFIPAAYKIITIEDTCEISLPHKNWIADTTRQGFSSS